MNRGNHWRTERRIKAAARGNNEEESKEQQHRVPLSDELMMDDSSERPGAYAITANDRFSHMDESDHWDPTEQTIAYGASLRDESSSSYRNQTRIDEEEACNDVVADFDLVAEESSPNRKGPTQRTKRSDIPMMKRTECRWLIAFGLVVLLAIIAVVAVFVVLSTNGSNGTAPQVNVEDPCDFSTTEQQPDPFLQCQCHNKISVITENVQNKYDSLVNYGLLKNQLGQLDDLDMQSCQAPNLALMWTAAEMQERQEILTFERVYTRFLLANLYATTTMGGKDNWERQANWLKMDASECVWWGVECNTEKQVIGIDLAGNNLKGTIDSRIGLLSDLRIVNLSLNQLTGSIPVELWSLPNLEELSLTANRLTGLLPTSSSTEQLVSPTLQILSLQGNPVRGPFPNWSELRDLQKLDLSKTGLGGPWPSFSGLTSLRQIDLSDTDTDHTMEDDDWIDFTRVEHFRLKNLPGLRGRLPSTLARMTSLKSLSITGASFGGSLPSMIGDLVNLEELYIVDNWLSGSLPFTLGQLTNLVTLFLPSNRLSGRIPPSIGNLIRLKSINFWKNDLTGPIPTELNQLVHLETLDLSFNTRLSGAVPIATENLTSAIIDSTQLSVPDGICDRNPPPKIVTSLKCACCEDSNTNPDFANP